MGIYELLGFDGGRFDCCEEEDRSPSPQTRSMGFTTLIKSNISVPRLLLETMLLEAVTYSQ
jgi:hypothetical protein